MLRDQHFSILFNQQYNSSVLYDHTSQQMECLSNLCVSMSWQYIYYWEDKYYDRKRSFTSKAICVITLLRRYLASASSDTT